MSVARTTYRDVLPTADSQAAVQALALDGEAEYSRGPASPEGPALLLIGLALLLSANPRRQEPVEDAFQGIVQNLACERVF
jgi:hypothetical protein